MNTRSIRNGLGACHTRPRRGFVIGGGGGSSPTRENRLARPRQRYLLLKESGSMRKSVMLAMVVAVLGATPGVVAQDDRGPDGQADEVRRLRQELTQLQWQVRQVSARLDRIRQALDSEPRPASPGMGGRIDLPAFGGGRRPGGGPFGPGEPGGFGSGRTPFGGFGPPGGGGFSGGSSGAGFGGPTGRGQANGPPSSSATDLGAIDRKLDAIIRELRAMRREMRP
jgi:hypothetical protein